MGVFDSVIMAPALQAQYGPLNDYWYQPLGVPTIGGQVVTPANAMGVSVVSTCVRIIAETVASVPCVIEENLSDDERRRARNHPLYFLLHDEPNEQMSSYEFWEWVGGVCALRGEAIAEKVPGPRGPVDQLIPIHPDFVQVNQIRSGPRRFALRYRVQDRETGRFDTLLDDEVFSVRWHSSDGVTALSPIGVLRENIGWAMAAHNHSNRFFVNATLPSGVLEHPGTLKETALDNLGKRLGDRLSGNNAHKPLILQEGMTWKTISPTMEDSQFLETLKEARIQITGAYRIPLHMIGEMEKETTWGSGIEQMQVGFVVYTMLPWFRRLEMAANRDLILAKQRYFVSFLLNGLMRGDQKSRYDAYEVGQRIGVLSPNEIRALEGMNPIPGGDAYFRMANMTFLDAPAPGATPTGAAGASPSPAGVPSQAALIVREAAARLVRKEIVAIGKAAKRSASDPDGFRSWVVEFYDNHAEDVSNALRLSSHDARRYCDRQVASLAADGVGVMTEWETEMPERLASLAMADQAVNGPRTTRKRVERDAQGRIAAVIEVSE